MGFPLHLSSAQRIGSGQAFIKNWVAGRFGSNGSIDIFDQVFLGTFYVHTCISDNSGIISFFNGMSQISVS